jgi:nicotinate-nucleotide adenylyltransferase
VSRIGILGGTFDPIHLGHLITAQSVLEIRNLERIIFIPAYISPHKQDRSSAGTEHRLKMLQLSIEGVPYFEYSDIELKAKSISYTVKTLEDFKKKYDNVDLIIGYDNVITFDKWKEPDKIVELAQLVVLRRRTDGVRAEGETKLERNKYFDIAKFVKTPVVEISSSNIRERIREGKPIDFLVPQKVKEYIYNHNLYKE